MLEKIPYWHFCFDKCNYLGVFHAFNKTYGDPPKFQFGGYNGQMGTSPRYVLNPNFDPSTAYSSDFSTKFNGPYKDESGQNRFVGDQENAECTADFPDIPPFEPGHNLEKVALFNALWGYSVLGWGRYGPEYIPLYKDPDSETDIDLRPAQKNVPVVIEAIAPDSETYEWGDEGNKLLSISSGLWTSKNETSATDLLNLANVKDGTVTTRYTCPLSCFAQWSDLFTVTFDGKSPSSMSFSVRAETVEYVIRSSE